MAEYSFKKLRVCKDVVRPKDAVTVLLPAAGGVQNHYQQHIERSAEDIERLGELPAPHWDPRLRHDETARGHLLYHLYMWGGGVSARRSTKCRVGLCFVKKEDGVIRMICDSRRPNALHWRPPRTRLCGMNSLVGLDLPGETAGVRRPRRGRVAARLGRHGGQSSRGTMERFL